MPWKRRRSSGMSGDAGRNGHLRAEDPREAGLEFGQAHGRFVTVAVGRVLPGRRVQFEDDHRRPAPQGSARKNAPLSPMEPQRGDATEAGHVQRAADRIDPLGRRQHVESHPGDHVVRRHAREIDARQLAGRAGDAVGADEVLGPQLVVTIRPADVHRDAVGVLVEAGKPVPQRASAWYWVARSASA